jgi:hypothetical protein
MQTVPTWKGAGVAFVTVNPGAVDLAQPRPVSVWAT